MHWRERISFYIYSATSDQQQRGESNKSWRFESILEARKVAEKMRTKEVPNVIIEQHLEFWDGYYNEWSIDWNRSNARKVVWGE